MKKDLIVIGAGACGIMAAIMAAKDKKSVLLLEKLPKIASKLKASGGGRCNLTNTLSQDDFMKKFGRQGRFMQDALKNFTNQDLREFFRQIGVETDSLDGFRVFPVGHSSTTIINALNNELKRLNVEVISNCKVRDLIVKDNKIEGVYSNLGEFKAKSVLIATGGKGYPKLGSQGDGYNLVKAYGHTIKELSPAMMPLKTKERWVANCRADTMPKVTMQVAIKKYKKLKAIGDLIFTKDGIRGPVVLDFSREITPLLEKYDEVPIVINLTKGLNYDQILRHFKMLQQQREFTTLELVETLLPTSVATELIALSGALDSISFSKQTGQIKDRLIKLLVETPLTIIGHNGFDMAMVTRGGISLKEIEPKKLESKLLRGLHFCGEVVDLDGPCGGYNLQWAFSSGALVGKMV